MLVNSKMEQDTLLEVELAVLGMVMHDQSVVLVEVVMEATI
jgi:hypothetical protein